MREILTVEEIELIQLAMECLYSELPEYGSVSAKLVAMRKAAHEAEHEPAAWIVRHPRFCGKFTDDKEIAEYWENKEQGCTAPLYLHPQPEPEGAKLVEALERLVLAAQCRDNSIGDQIRLIETRAELSAAAKNAEEALALYRQQKGEA